MSQPQFILISDGGSDEKTSGAGACIVRVPEQEERYKLIGILGPVSGSQAELAAALIGWCFVVEYSRANSLPTGHVHWVSDNKPLLFSSSNIREWQARGWRTHSERSVANRGLWEAFIELSAGQTVTVEHIRGHCGHRENEACDRAARWIQRKGEKLLRIHGEGRIGQLAVSAPEQAWTLLDMRRPMSALLESTKIKDAVAEMRQIVVRQVSLPQPP